MDKLSNNEKVQFLLSQGWTQIAQDGWCWKHPRFTSAFYRLNDAFDLAQFEQREHSAKVLNNTKEVNSGKEHVGR